MKLGLLIPVALLLSCDPGSPGAQTAPKHEYLIVEGYPPVKLICESDIEEHVPIFCEVSGDMFSRRAVYIPLSRTEIREMNRVSQLVSTPLTLPYLRKNDGTKEGAPVYLWLVNIVALRKASSGARAVYLTDWSCLDLGELEAIGDGDKIDEVGRSPKALEYLGLQAPPIETDKTIVLTETNGKTVTLPLFGAFTECSREYGAF